MKKILSIFFFLFSWGCFASCNKSTEFDDKKGIRMETITTEGFSFGPPPLYKRIFDFTRGIVFELL